VDEDAEGRDGSVAGIYLRTCRPLVGLLTVMGGSRTEAEEIAQDAFVKLLEHWERVRDHEHVDAWLRTVAVRMLVSRHRRRAVAARGLHLLTARAQRTAPATEPGERLDLTAALARLSVEHRAVLLLHHVHDLPVDEVATLLRLSPGTVKSRLSRARAALGPLLADPDHERTPQ
jgi:RNA polymerase sigma-70 factor (ECF subfamily)